MINEGIVATILNSLKQLGDTIWNVIFGNVNFGVLWSWLPSDIAAACTGLVLLLFSLAVIKFIRSILPF